MSHAGAPNTEATVSAVRAYWDSHPLGLQYVTDPSIEVGTPEFFEHIRPWMNPYKFPWIMDRIERESKQLQDKHLLDSRIDLEVVITPYLGGCDACESDVSLTVDGGEPDVDTLLPGESARFEVELADVATECGSSRTDSGRKVNRSILALSSSSSQAPPLPRATPCT